MKVPTQEIGGALFEALENDDEDVVYYPLLNSKVKVWTM